ncbi:helix-turn-helix domain-containing protein [Rhodococcoides fascians]|uniref:helix-turn-helix domain-containing protein n=1 Tax=Rhodococcoides fascians TaxID=1828 RepID=UPI0012D2ED29|nr:helix-turn-helix transcriptional regulator [Rhodococcus fascians]
MSNNDAGKTRGSAEAREWAAEAANRMGQAVAKVRKKRGLSALQLSTLTEDLGYPVTRGSIAKIEGGHRGGKFDVAEILVLAAALQVPPVLLLFPDFPDGQVRVLPQIEVDSLTAAQWLSGELQIDRLALATGASWVRQLTDEERLMDAVRKRQAAAGSIRVQDLIDLEEKHGPDSQALKDWIGKLENDRAVANAEITQLGGTVSDA